MNAYLIPQTVYVGDRAELTIILQGTIHTSDTVLLPGAPAFPVSPDIEFHRIVLESRPAVSRLIIEFTPFAPGVLEFPVIEIGGRYFGDITVEINSIIGEGEALVLSPPASLPAVPGSGFLIFCTISAVIMLVAFSLWMAVSGKSRLAKWLSFRKLRRLVFLMARAERRLRKMLQHKNARSILDTLSSEFRSFLSLYTGENCRTMTAAEVGQLSGSAFTELMPEKNPDTNLRINFLGNFLMRCDDLRFGGNNIVPDDVQALLAELRVFLVSLDKMLREQV